MTVASGQRTPEVVFADGRLTFRLACGHVFVMDRLERASSMVRDSHQPCPTCAAAPAPSQPPPTPRRPPDRRCASCGQIDLRPRYGPPSSTCFRCHSRLFFESGDEPVPASRSTRR
ncbi:MAG TPA: hypothetical protein VE987_23005 [Polyangiaceae bacterium]|nr:hypothetical protein [Polyangiaceae bacterium]